MRRGSWWSLASWTLVALLLAAAPRAWAEEGLGGESASAGGGGNEALSYFQYGNVLSCEYNLAAFSFPLPPFVIIVGYLRCQIWPDSADP